MRRPVHFPRGFNLIEAMIALLVFSVGILGLASVQALLMHTNRFGQRLQLATELTNDFLENAKRWPYADARLASRALVTSTTDSQVTGFWDLGRSATLSNKPSYSDAATDPNAVNAGALTLSGTSWQGLAEPLDSNGKPIFTRYWNVWDVDLANTGTAQGKLVQVIVRWYEPGVGQRQVTGSTFRLNTGAFFQ